VRTGSVSAQLVQSSWPIVTGAKDLVNARTAG
jgi:hypothetical protein